MKVYILLLVSILPISAATWHVRSITSCPNNGTGTTSACAASVGATGAWSIGGANPVTNISWASMSAGDTLSFFGGDTYSISADINIGVAGTSSAHITINVENLAGGAAVIDASGIDPATCAAVFNFQGNNWVDVNGLQGDKTKNNTNYGMKITGLRITANGAAGCQNRIFYENSGGGGGNISMQHIEIAPDTSVSCTIALNGNSGFNITKIQRASNVVTVTTDIPHGLPNGTTVCITGISDASFNVCPTITSVPTSTTFTFNQTGANTTVGNGTTNIGLVIGSCFDDNSSGAFIQSSVGNVNFKYNWMHGVSVSVQAPFTCGIFNVQVVGATDFTTGGDLENNQCEFLFHDGLRPGYNYTVKHNVFRYVAGSGHSDAVEPPTVSYVDVDGNYFFTRTIGDQAIYPSCVGSTGTFAHYRIHNNVLDWNPGFGVPLDPDSAGCRMDDVVIVNNTFYNTSAAAIRSSDRGNTFTNVDIRNNIFGTNTDTAYRPVEPSTFFSFVVGGWDYDVYSTSGANFPCISFYNGTDNCGGQAGTQDLATLRTRGFELHGKTGIPTYLDPVNFDYRLSTADTVARGAGVNLTNKYPWAINDKDGNPRPAHGAWDMGAYQTPQAKKIFDGKRVSSRIILVLTPSASSSNSGSTSGSIAK